jgi:hypothetical protein
MERENLSVNGISAQSLKDLANSISEAQNAYQRKRQELKNDRADLQRNIHNGYLLFDQCLNLVKSIAKQKPELNPMVKEISRRRKSSVSNTVEPETTGVEV